MKQLRALVRASSAYFASGVFFMVYLWIDSVMLSLMTRNEVVGWYAVPTKLLGTLVFLPVIITNAWGPESWVRTFENSPHEMAETARTPIRLVARAAQPAVERGVRPGSTAPYPASVRQGL